MRQAIRRIERWVTLGVLLAAIGCMHVISQTADYYKDGPLQPGPPDGELAAGTPVWVFDHKGSYVRVWAQNGVFAYVWDRAVKPAWEKQTEKPAKPASAADTNAAPNSPFATPPPKAPEPK